MTFTPEDLGRALMGRRFTYTNEYELQDQIARVLAEESYAFTREVRLSTTDRIDFMVGRIGIEVKVAGNSRRHIAQLRRYARHPQVHGLLLVTARRAPNVPSRMNGKPVNVLSLLGAGL